MKMNLIKTYWLIMTNISENSTWSDKKVKLRQEEIEKVSAIYGFDEVFNLAYAPAKLDQVPLSELVQNITDVLNKVKPTEILIPHYSDIHSDHRITFDAVASSVKWFRNAHVKRILAYETLSETEFSLNSQNRFNPNYFVNIEKTFDKKIEILTSYDSEIGEFPFPRSVEAVRALALLLGSNSGFMYAEAFELLRELD